MVQTHHGKSEKQVVLPKSLLDKYRQAQTGQGWHTVPDDGYLYDHLVAHLQAEGAGGEIRRLFADDQWLRVRVDQGGYTGYLADLTVARELAAAEASGQLASGMAPIAVAELLR